MKENVTVFTKLAISYFSVWRVFGSFSNQITRKVVTENLNSLISCREYSALGTVFLFSLRMGIFGNFAPGYSRLISGGILGSRKLPLLRKSYTHCMISNYQHTSVNQIVIARNRKPLCSDLPFKMRWFRPSNPIKCAVIDCQNYRLSE